MMDRCRFRSWRAGLGALILPLTAVALVAVLAAPVRAGVTVRFDPTGGGGVNPGVTINASQFTWAPGNAVAIGAITPGSGPNVGTTFELKYQAILLGINGTTQLGGGVSITSQQNDTTPANGGEIRAGTTDTGREVTITADFREVITAKDADGTLHFALVAGAPNVVSIYSALAQTAKNFAGTGFDAGTLILQGSVIQNGIEGSYASVFKTSPNAPVAFNQYPAASDAAANAFWAGTSTTSGTGSTFLPVQIDPTKTNAAFFPTGGPGIFQLTFPSISTADPFNSVEPSKTFFGGTTPSLGATNGFSSTDVQFQVLASNDFAVPEPASIVSTLTAATLIPAFLYLRRRRSSKPTVA